jgi:amidase
MGDGQVSGTGIETGAEVKIRVQVKKQFEIAGPRVETAEGTYFIASAEKLEDAIYAATKIAVDFIQVKTGLAFSEAYMMAGVGCQLRVSQVVNPLFTVKFFVPRLLQVLQE